MKNIVKISLSVLFLGIGTGIALFLSLFNSAYTDIAVLHEDIRTSWCQVESVYRRRTDIIPHIVTLLQQYANDEQPFFEQLLEQNQRMKQPPLCDGVQCECILNDRGAFEAFQKTHAQFELQIHTLFDIIEQYPQIQSDIHFRVLIIHLKDNTRRIIGKRKRYNNLVANFNSLICTLPYSIPAAFYGFKLKAFLEGDEIEKTNTLLPK